MFATVQGLCSCIDNDIKWLTEGIASGKADADYIEAMKQRIDKRFQRLKGQSCNDRLIDKYQRKINNLP